MIPKTRPLRMPKLCGVETLTAREGLPAGKVRVRYEFAADQPGRPSTGGRGRLFIGEKLVGENRLAHSVPLRFSS